jgi:membrane-bound lytic murein transglycosylase D
VPAAAAPAPVPEETAAAEPEEAAQEEIFKPVSMEELADLSFAGEAGRDETVPAPELVGSEEVQPGKEEAAADEDADTAATPQKPAVQYDMPLENHKRVFDYIERFQTTRRASFLRGLRRSKIYEKTAKDIFREEGVPTDLYYLALIESAFNPKAYSRARAMGIWQFIYTTGKSYGLRRNHWIDERRDPEKASRAAARHLKDLYEDLGSWPLALASYNAGINRVKRAIKKAGTRNFWALRLPAQTRNYVPAFYAALMIAKDPEGYGFSVRYDKELEVEKVAVEGGTRLSLVASFCGTSLQEIRDMNPELRQGCAPPGGRYDLKIPPGKTNDVADGLARTPKPKITGWGTYRIRTGDTLSTIASRFGTSVPAVQEVNNLAGHFIRAGDTLVIPGSGVVGSIPELPDEGFVVPPSGVHRVRRGDSLWSISRRYRIPLERLMDINALNPQSVLQIGQVVRLRDETRSKVASAEQKPSGGGTFFYRVRRGDNLWKISRKFGTDMDAILRVNRMSKGQTLYPGDRLIIPGS